MAATPATAQIARPGTAPARGPDLPRPDGDRTPAAASASATPTPADPAQPTGPIVPEAEFDAALPPLSGDINAPLEPMPAEPAPATPATGAVPAATRPIVPGDTLGPISPEDPALAAPLTPLSAFDTAPLQAAVIASPDSPDIRYDVVVRGLEALKLEDAFKGISALHDGKGKAANAAQVAARAREDEALAVRLMQSLGY